MITAIANRLMRFFIFLYINYIIITLIFYPIRNILVPHFGQVPLVAFLPFFNLTAIGLLISFFALHLTQYPVILPYPPIF
jgi:ABC-type polysaccharide/polyol phosphate export permease